MSEHERSGEDLRNLTGTDSGSTTVSRFLDRAGMRSAIDKVEAYADAGKDAPAMAQFWGPLRPVARLVGRGVQFLTSFITDQQRAFNNQSVQSLRAVASVLSLLEDRLNVVDDRLSSLDDRLNSLDNRSSRIGAVLDTLVRERFEKDLTVEKIRQLRHSILDQQQRLTVLLEENRDSAPRGSTPEILASEAGHMQDAMYLAFEDRFRGTREEIKERLQVYRPYVEKVLSALGPVPVLDVGCGRGEWLEILRDCGVTARGLDLNRMMVHNCREMGFDVIESDVIGYLRSLDSGTVGVITGFHIVEHLEPGTLIALFDESFRVLKPGGMVIFETPNPENLIVGACNFYYDPTHRNPLPPVPLQFILEQRGFENTEILRLHPNLDFQDRHKEQKDNSICYDFFVKEQDYSVIGYKR